MNSTTLLRYVIAVSAVTIMPGPTMLLALNNGASRRTASLALRCPISS
jgi:homoserine/homoserine lactone efflux protein